MKRGSQYWSAAWRRRYAMAALLGGHLFWVFLSKQALPMWRSFADLCTRPVETIAAKLENWKYERSQKIKSIEDAQQELDALRSAIAELRLERSGDASLLAEADEATRLLGLKKMLPFEVQAARIIANNRNAPFGGIVIDLGANDGIEEDQGVISSDGVVGRIWSVGRSQSLVLPLDAYNASTSVMLARSRATGVLQGLKPGMAAIRYISIQETVQRGEPVYTSQLDNVFPKGMLVGYVSDTSQGPLEMNIVVTLAASLDRLGLVFVLPFANRLEFGTELKPPQGQKRGAK